MMETHLASGNHDPPSIEYTDGKALMKQGADALHDHFATHVEVAMGKRMPQMEVRFKDLCVSAEVEVSSKSNSQELPTCINALKSMLPGHSTGTSTATKHILRNVNGVFKPGRMTLVLGQPGSGKSSLMKVLSGRFPQDKNITVEGEVTYNGTPGEVISKQLPQLVSYVAQHDHHYATLSVKETLVFAHAFRGGKHAGHVEAFLDKGSPEQNKAALDATRAIFEHYPEVITHQLGLESCQDTVVGDAMTRGVSGGERKRVTIGEMQFGSMYVAMMDEISTGLDSAATYDIIKTQLGVARLLHRTVVISLLQPSPEVFGLFDEVMVLNDGYVMYYGPCDQVMNYFTGMGFHCPPHRDTADFLLDLGTYQQRMYEPDHEKDGKLPQKPREFAELFQRSSIHQFTLSNLADPHDPVLLADMNVHFSRIPEFHQSFLANTWTIIVRDFTRIIRNTAFLQARVATMIVMGFIFVSLFWDFDPKSAQVSMGLMFASILCLALGQVAQVPTIMANREVFYKHRGANLLRTSSYVVASSVSQVPMAVMETLIFGSIVYWLCGFVASVSAYLVFELLLFMITMTFAAWFFFLSAAAPNVHVAEPVSVFAVLFFIVFAGFIITKDQIPAYFIWIYWINPVAWGLRGLAINQYLNDEFDTCSYDGFDYCATYGKRMGLYTLGLYEVQTDKMWVWYGVVVLGITYTFIMHITYLALEFKRYEVPENIGFSQAQKHTQGKSGDRSSCSSDEPNFALLETPRGGSNGDTIVDVKPTAYEHHFVPVTLAFQDLWYTVPNPTNPKTETIDLLKGISGFAMPGSITALMGSSGAGKTTLMDVVAGRKTGGQIRGQILLNGHEATELAIQRCTGYCEQMDFHSESSTFREALTFSAFLRQGSDVPDSYKFDSVEECLDLLDLRPIADQIIRGSSLEQMKRLTIGVELAAQPSVLFLDEPTSGLDARSAKMIMNGVRKVADSGRTVVCTIHQPSSEVFFVFDSLLLLKRGGETVYFGELGKKGSKVVKYFESVAGVAPIPEEYNPATWMLEVIGAGVGNSAGDDTNFVRVFNASDKKAQLDHDLNRAGITFPDEDKGAVVFASKRAASEWTQAKFVIGRHLTMYWRTPAYNITRFIVVVFVALLLGLSYVSVSFNTYQGINSGLGMFFQVTVFLGTVTLVSVLPVADEERKAFYRERASQTYNSFWYFVGCMVAEIPYVLASSLVFMAIFFPLAGFSGGDRFVLEWLVMFLWLLSQTYFGQFLAYALPNVEVATNVGMLFSQIFLQFLGFNPPSEVIPTGYKWLHYITPPRYSFQALTAIVFADCPDPADPSELSCQFVENLPPTVPGNLTIKGYLEEVFNSKHDDIGFDVGILVGVNLFFLLLTLLALRFINHQKR